MKKKIPSHLSNKLLLILRLAELSHNISLLEIKLDCFELVFRYSILCVCICNSLQGKIKIDFQTREHPFIWLLNETTERYTEQSQKEWIRRQSHPHRVFLVFDFCAAITRTRVESQKMYVSKFVYKEYHGNLGWYGNES